MRKIFRIALYILVMLLVFAGCGNKNVVVTVNGEDILKDELEKRTKQVAAMYQYDLENPDNQETAELLRDQVLQSIIEEKLLRQDAAAKKIEITKEEIDSEMENIRGQFESEDAYQQFLQERLFTEEELKTFVENQLLLNKIFEEVTKDISEPLQDPREYYEAHKESFKQAEMVNAQHILVSTEAEAKEVIERLDKGEDFGDLAVELSLDPTAKENKGVINYFTRQDMLMEQFKEAAFALEVGEYTKTPVLTMYGFHVIKTLDKVEAKQYEFEEIKEDLEGRLILEAKQQEFTKYMDKLQAEAELKGDLPKQENTDIETVPAEGTEQPATEAK